MSGNSGTGIEMFPELRAGIVVTLTSSTVSGNSGGGIAAHNNEDITAAPILTNSTVAFNSVFGIHNTRRCGNAYLTNSIVAQNGATGDDVVGTQFIARFSLIGDGSGSGLTNTDGNQVGNVPPHSSPIDPRLGPLAENGGPTRTHALLLGSPAIDAASTPDCPTTDQRGVLPPQGAACDIGSYERE